MKRLFAIYIGLIMSICLSWSQILEEYMLQMVPKTSQLPQEHLARMLDMGDKHFQNVFVQNVFDDTTKLLAYERNNYALIQMSDHGYVSAKRWQIDDTTQVCGYSSWVCGSMCDGWWQFKTLGKRKIEVPVIVIGDFFDKDALVADSLTEASLSQRLEMIFLHCEFGKGDSLYIYSDTERYLEADRKKKYAKYFKGNRLTLLPVDGVFKIVAVERREDYNEAHE